MKYYCNVSTRNVTFEAETPIGHPISDPNYFSLAFPHFQNWENITEYNHYITISNKLCMAYM